MYSNDLTYSKYTENAHIWEETKYNPIKHLETCDHILVDMVGVELGPGFRYLDIIKWTHKFIFDESEIKPEKGGS